jgi:hypothetical protein
MNENPIQGITHKKNENFSEDGILTWITMRILSFPRHFWATPSNRDKRG